MRIALLMLIGLIVSGFSPPEDAPRHDDVDPAAALAERCIGVESVSTCTKAELGEWLDAASEAVNSEAVSARAGYDACSDPALADQCAYFQQIIAAERIGALRFPLPLISGEEPNTVCRTPLGDAPCHATQAYFAQLQAGAFEKAEHDLQNVSLRDGLPGGEPLCTGPLGPTTCSLLSQYSLDRARAPLIGYDMNPDLEAAQVARICAHRVGLDIVEFANCTGKTIVLRDDQQSVLDCAMSNAKVQEFAACSAAQLGYGLPEAHLELAACAVGSGQNRDRALACAGASVAGQVLNEDQIAIVDCGIAAAGDSLSFADCAGAHFLSEKQRDLIACAVNGSGVSDFLTCAGPPAGLAMSDEQRLAVKCAASSASSSEDFATCVGGALLGQSLTSDQVAVLTCATNSSTGAAGFAGCAAETLLQGQLSREQEIAIRCAAESAGDPTATAVCAGANMFNIQANPEQQIVVQCLASTGGQPHAAGGCIASRLMIRELSKCFANGVGGDGCFGDSNDLVGRNGWTARTLKQLAGGPNSLVNNPDQIWGGDNSFLRNPGQIWGGDNSFVRNPSQIWGGENSVFNNPPPALQLGTIGGHRICFPWC